MNTTLNGARTLLGAALAALLVAGCAQQQQRRETPVTTMPAPAPAPAPVAPTPARGYGPSYATIEENGTKWIRGSMAYPSGLREGSGLLIEKIVPAEVLAGQIFDYRYQVSNLTDYPIEDVVLFDRVTPNFAISEADPKPAETRAGIAKWLLGTFKGKETKIIRVRGAVSEEGTMDTCGWATYNPVLCEEIRIVKANIQLAKIAPAEVSRCDPIPVVLAVKNNGSSPLTGVKITDTLPDGLTCDGKTTVTFDVGNLAPGEVKELKFTAAASKTGSFPNKAEVTSTQGVKAQAVATTVVREPKLEVTCVTPEERYIGRPFNIAFKVTNKGDWRAERATLAVPVPATLTVASASSGGTVGGGGITWDLGTLAANESKEVTATLNGPTAGTYSFDGVAQAVCAAPVKASCQTRLVGVGAILLEKADDPDPVGVGETTTYTIKITNQGTADNRNVQLVVTIAPELVPVSATKEGAISGQVVTFPVVPSLASKEWVEYKVVAKGAKPGDGHTLFTLSADLLKKPITAEESTHVY